jgi:hypothetical protein
MISATQSLILAKEEINMGRMTVSQANVYMVQLEGVRIVGKMPARVRKDLNQAVKNGELGHIKKSGLRPEAYHHKNARANALEAIDREFNRAVDALRGVYA